MDNSSNPSAASSSATDANKADNTSQPTSQGKTEFRKGWPEWIRQLPHRIEPMNEKFQLIKEEELRSELKAQNISDDVIKEIADEIKNIDYEITRLFRERDYDASQHQNEYRSTQLYYMLLATGATVVGSMQALSFGSNPHLVPYLAFFQTIIAGGATFLALLGKESALGDWMENRRRAEFLRREYFRYLVNLSPYEQDGRQPYEVRQVLSKHAADINSGVFPAED